LKIVYKSDIYDIVMQSLRKCTFREALSSLLLIATRKCGSKIIESILTNLKQHKGDILNYWLKTTDKDGRTILHVLIQELLEYTNHIMNYKDCINILLEYRNYLNIDAQDSNGDTALHYAVKVHDKHGLAIALIRNGACINVKNKLSKCVIDEIPPNTIKDILNQCIEEPDISSVDRDDLYYRIKMDFSIFSHKESLDSKNESSFIESLHHSTSHKHLLNHPLVASFLDIKWQKVKTIYILSIVTQILYNLLLFGLIAYPIFRPIVEDCVKEPCDSSNVTNDENGKPNYKTVISILCIFIMIREIIQVYTFKKKYLQSFENYLEVTILFLTIGMLCCGPKDDYYKQSIEALLVIFMPMELLLHLESFHMWHVSHYIRMFRRVAWNYFKLIYLLVGMFMAFGVSFYISFQIPGRKENKDEFQNVNKTENLYAPKLLHAVARTLFMSTGEFNFSRLTPDQWENYPFSIVIAALFIFFIFLVSMNFLNGMAVNDFQTMQNDTYRNVIDQVETITVCENFWKRGHIFENLFPSKVIILYPNQDNFVRYDGKKTTYKILPEFVNIAMEIKEKQERIQQKNEMCDKMNEILLILKTVCSQIHT